MLLKHPVIPLFDGQGWLRRWGKIKEKPGRSKKQRRKALEVVARGLELAIPTSTPFAALPPFALGLRGAEERTPG